MTHRRTPRVAVAGVLVSLAAGTVALAPGGAATRVSAAQCGTTDLGIGQAASTDSATGDVVYTLSVENLGGCNATNVTVVDTLPQSAAVTIVGLNPSNWSCPADGTVTAVVTCTLGQLSGPGSTPDNPGKGTVSFETAPPSGGNLTNMASVSADQTDPNPTNNQTWGGFVPAGGGTIQQGPDAPTLSIRQTSSVHVPEAASVQVQDLPTSVCAPVSASCFGFTPLGISTLTTTTAQTFVFNIDANLPGVPRLGKLSIYHQADGSTVWVKLALCGSGPVPAVGCVQSMTKLTDPALVSAANPKGIYYHIVVLTLTNGRWM